MSFVRLDNGDFPPLDKVSQSQKVAKRTKTYKKVNNDFSSQHYFEEDRMDEDQTEVIGDSNDFIRCRVGLQLNEFHYELNEPLNKHEIGQYGDFIIANIAPEASPKEGEPSDPVADLCLPEDTWLSRVAINLGTPKFNENDPTSGDRFDKMFSHALYLPTPLIIINCPPTSFECLTLATIINERLAESRNYPLVLFKVNMSETCESKEDESPWSSVPPLNLPIEEKSSDKSKSSISDQHSPQNITYNNDLGNDDPSQNSNNPFDDNLSSWNRWNCIRSFLTTDTRIGVCLSIDDDLPTNQYELDRWKGEPVRMFVVTVDQFSRSIIYNSLKVNVRCKQFIKDIATHNSLKTSLVVQEQSNQSMREYLHYFDELVSSIKALNQDYLLRWNDKIQPPLQPLSSNLDSGTYRIFELDSMKYIKYKEAMIEAIKVLEIQEEATNRRLVLMVLGAGRGPLVDCFIEAVRSINTKRRFKLFALDKNPSSVITMRYKRQRDWLDPSGQIETEVVESDMRVWKSNVKADIIATELLGSLSDNELSPECIDGVWSLSTKKTISIPQEYSSYIAPICSYKLQQELHRLKVVESNVFDRIYVVKLNNIYLISEPQELFKFEHKDLNVNPKFRCNRRFIKLIFWSHVDTVCHGFAGYFTAKLFGNVSLSTLVNDKTPNMDSWFPAYIPLEQPVQMPKGTKLEVHFWRRENAATVWYQWAVLDPVPSRVYSQNGVSTAMSKFI